MTNLVKENGIDFDPQEDYLKKVRAAGGKEDLLNVLRDSTNRAHTPPRCSPPMRICRLSSTCREPWNLKSWESYPQAEAEYRAALAIQSQDSTLHLGLGRALSKQEKWDEALAEYREAIRLDPKSAEAHAALGLAIGLRGDPARAIPELRTAMQLNPQDLQARNILAASLYNVHDIGGCAKEYAPNC